MRAFYFSAADRRLRYSDGRACRTGRTHRVKGTPVLCKHGLHASVKVMDALTYAPGPYLWLVELGGELVKGDDKCVASERTYLAGFDATAVLRHFARRQASINVHLMEPYCSAEEFNVIKQWLDTGDESLRYAARYAARSAAEYAAKSAAEYAAESATKSAAKSAAESAAESAAWSAAYAARSAAESAADATWSAAWSAAEEMLVDMLPPRFKQYMEEAR